MKKENCKTPYKVLSPENKRIWDRMKYLVKNFPEKYYITKRYKIDFQYPYIGRIQHIWIHRIEIHCKDENKLQPYIELRTASGYFEGYEYCYSF